MSVCKERTLVDIFTEPEILGLAVTSSLSLMT